MTPEAAVSDFIAYLDNIRQELLDAGEDPSEHLVDRCLGWRKLDVHVRVPTSRQCSPIHA